MTFPLANEARKLTLSIKSRDDDVARALDHRQKLEQQQEITHLTESWLADLDVAIHAAALRGELSTTYAPATPSGPGAERVCSILANYGYGVSFDAAGSQLLVSW